MKILWSPRARSHLRQIQEFIADDNPVAALETAKKLIDAVERLAVFPASGRPGLKPDTRELVVPGTPFIIPYRIKNEIVEILGVLHTARRWPDPEP